MRRRSRRLPQARQKDITRSAPRRHGCRKHFKGGQRGVLRAVRPGQKAKYDQFGKAAFDPTAGAGGRYNSGFTDLGILVIFSGIFRRCFRRRHYVAAHGSPARRGCAGASTLSFEEAVAGCRRKSTTRACINAPPAAVPARSRHCRRDLPDCHGSGQRVVVQRMGGMSFQSRLPAKSVAVPVGTSKRPAPSVGAPGWNAKTAVSTVTIPAGIDDGDASLCADRAVKARTAVPRASRSSL